MKNLIATAALVSAIATSATAMDWSWENEITAEYMVDAEKTSIVYEPEMSIGIVADWAVDIGTKIPMYDSTATGSIVLFDNLDDGSRPNIDFEINYAGIADNVELYGKTHWDIDEAERGDITLGASFKF
mgnify:CR=1 FL=1